MRRRYASESRQSWLWFQMIRFRRSPETMSSAYVMADGQEPEFTNLASNAWGGDAFCETLDYIFLSTGDGWR